MTIRLIDLTPRWLELDGRKVGMIFRCPLCHAQNRKQWLSCFFEPMPVLNGGEWPNQYALFEKVIDEGDNLNEVVPCNKTAKWSRSTDDFHSMSVTPSLDSSAAGHWHGFITNGECR